MKIHKTTLFIVIALLLGILFAYSINYTLLNTDSNNMFSVYEIY